MVDWMTEKRMNLHETLKNIPQQSQGCPAKDPTVKGEAWDLREATEWQSQVQHWLITQLLMGICVGVWKKVRCIKHFASSKSRTGILGCHSSLSSIRIEERSFIAGLTSYGTQWSPHQPHRWILLSLSASPQSLHMGANIFQLKPHSTFNGTNCLNASIF